MTNAAIILGIFALTVMLAVDKAQSELNDDVQIERLCYPELHKNTRKSCECSVDNAPPWGIRAVTIDCSFKQLLSGDISAELPLYADRLDLSWNTLESVPQLNSGSLRLLNLMHNNITLVKANNFQKISNLKELYLSWNSIQTLEPHAFNGLSHLQVLDLSHNNLVSLEFHIFSPLSVLEKLSISWNRQLNQTEGIQELDFYKTFGVNTNLQSLNLGACNLNNITLPKNCPLKELLLRRNRLERVPEFLPLTLEKIDLSENLFEALLPSDTKHLSMVHELYMEDMTRLQVIEENSFVPLISLRKISFLNSRRLNAMDEFTFGTNASRSPTLHTMIFRGTGLRGFNSTLAPVFFQLAVLDLNGMPLLCDCQLAWIKEVRIETNGRCFWPSRLRGVSLKTANPNDFSCERWPRWVYGIIVLSLICLCSVGIYFLVVGLRPKNGVTMRRRVGTGSPYARVTIEPNRQENY